MALWQGAATDGCRVGVPVTGDELLLGEGDVSRGGEPVPAQNAGQVQAHACLLDPGQEARVAGHRFLRGIQQPLAGKDDPIKSGEYRLYPIGRTVLSSQCYVWFDWSWFVQFHDVSGLYNPDEAGKQWDVFASIRFEGPAYSPQTPAKQNRFYVDRVVFVAAER